MSSYSDPKDFEIIHGELVKYHGHDSVVRVPEGVTSIGEGAFTRPVTFLGFSGPPPMCSWDGMETSPESVGTHEEPVGFEFIREVYLPESVKTIGQNAFHLCKNLEYVHLPSNLSRISSKAFERCYKLKQIEVPAQTIIEWRAFMTSVRIIRMPER